MATAAGLGSLRSRSFTVAAGTPATLTFLTQPQNAHAGSSLGSVTAQFYDQYGNVVTTAGTQVTMGISSGTLKGTTTAATNALGRAIFNTLTETMAGTYTLQATGAGLSATSHTFVVSANTASRLTFLVQPAAATVGGNLGLVTVQVDDAFGNPIAGQTVTITGSTDLDRREVGGDGRLGRRDLQQPVGEQERHVHADRLRRRQDGDVEPVHDHGRLTSQDRRGGK